jgi:hypothetical protein
MAAQRRLPTGAQDAILPHIAAGAQSSKGERE